MTGDRRSTEVREAARCLAGYLTGTHSGIHKARSARHISAGTVVERFRRVDGSGEARGEHHALGGQSWTPPKTSAGRELRDSLAHCLASDDVIDLVLFGSLARGSTTGYSDVDAILVVADDVPLGVDRLRALRPNVLAAERVVLAYQPLQHHGFVVVTLHLLRHASAALGLPANALETTSSLFGRASEARIDGSDHGTPERFDALAQTLLRTSRWPGHVWELHRTVAMFELAPALYLQAMGRPCAKHESFDICRGAFRNAWRPYDVLEEVRTVWPRKEQPALRLAAASLRNPWAAVAVWRRLPAAIPEAVGELLRSDVLDDLKRLVESMDATARRVATCTDDAPRAEVGR